MKYSAILFDLDGTLMNTIKLYERAVIDTIRGYGATLTPRRFAEIYRSGDSISEWIREFGIDPEKKHEIRSGRDKRYMELLRTSVEWYPGAELLLRTLQVSSPLGLVTGSWKTYLEAIEERLPFHNHFETIVTADDMGAFPKPHPHALLLAADRLSIDPKTSVYIGDQSFDIAAAKSAGMKSILVETEYTPEDAGKNADFVVKSLREIQKILSLV
ncbi:MAG: HAD family phosphatase [Patescibacteria group bacterium]